MTRSPAAPRLSVICPTFDTEGELLLAAVRSVLDEPDGRVAEVIVVDDGSTRPDTLAAMRQLEENPRVVVLRTPGRLGAGAARNLGIARATAPWISFCDADDLWLPGRAALLEKTLALDPAAGWVAGNYVSLFPDGRTTPGVLLAPLVAGAQSVAPGLLRCEGPALTRALLAHTELHHCACCIRADLLREAGGYGEGLSIGEDLLLLLRLSTRTPFHGAEDPVYVYRRERPSVMSSTVRITEGFVPYYRRAAREPGLAPFAREIRWALYSAEKARALHALIAGRRGTALMGAVRAYARDPREIADLTRFLRLWLAGPAAAERDGADYSHAERFKVRRAG